MDRRPCSLPYLRLAADGHLLRVDDVAQLQRTAVHELRTAQVVQLCRVVEAL